MATSRMKRLRLIAMRNDREALLRELMLAGCVEILRSELLPGDETLSRESAGLLERKGELDSVLRAIELLERYTHGKTRIQRARPSVEKRVIMDEGAIESGLALVHEIEKNYAAICAIEAEISRLRSEIESLEPWISMEVPLELSETRSCSVLTGMIPAQDDLDRLERALTAGDCESAIYEISSDDNMRYILIIIMKDTARRAMGILRGLNFTRSSLSEREGTPGEAVSGINSRLGELEKERAELVELIKFRKGRQAELKLCADRLMILAEAAENAERLLYSSSTFTLEGWLPSRSEERVIDIISKYDCLWETREPSEEEAQDAPADTGGAIVGKLFGGGRRALRPLAINTQFYDIAND